MSIKKGLHTERPRESREAEDEVAGTSDAHEPRKMTFAENMILTVKVLLGFGLLGAVLWGIDLWTSIE